MEKTLNINLGIDKIIYFRFVISILIPTYDYNVLPLAQELEKQALKLGAIFELICLEDGSFSTLNEINQKINSLTNCKFIENKKNFGRVATRIQLAEMAQYDWLIFLDADVMPKNSDFIEVIFNHINEGKADAIFGGFAYNIDAIDENKSLRFTFGKKREEIMAEVRNKNPYKVIISANMLIKKEVFLKLAKTETSNVYGMDYFFGSLLKKNNYKVLHIDNEVYHYGLEDNQTYLNKTKQALQNLYKLETEKKIGTNQISILTAYRFLKSFGLKGIFSKTVKLFIPNIEKKLTGPEPNLFLFDLYRLSYLCKL